MEEIVADRNSLRKWVWRADIVLATADRRGTNAIMRRTGKSKPCVWRWQERYLDEGVPSLLRDKTRPSRIAPLAAEKKLAHSIRSAKPLQPMAESLKTKERINFRSGSRHSLSQGEVATPSTMDRSGRRAGRCDLADRYWQSLNVVSVRPQRASRSSPRVAYRLSAVHRNSSAVSGQQFVPVQQDATLGGKRATGLTHGREVTVLPFRLIKRHGSYLAGASARIGNYLGLPIGISGMAPQLVCLTRTTPPLTTLRLDLS